MSGLRSYLKTGDGLRYFPLAQMSAVHADQAYASVDIMNEHCTTVLSIAATGPDELDAMERLGNELIRAVNMARALAPALHAAAPDSSPGAASTPRDAAPGEPETATR